VQPVEGEGGKRRINAITRPNAMNGGLQTGEKKRQRNGYGLTFNSLGHNNDVTTFAMAKQKLNTISCKQKPK